MQVVSLLLGASSLSVEHVTIAPELLAIDAATTLPMSNCPCCGGVSSHVHSRYVRKLADLPAHGVAVKLRVRVRRFFCDNAECPRRIFAERLGTLAQDHAPRPFGWAHAGRSRRGLRG
jgi:transposase